MPTFFVATVFKLIFSVKLGWFELVGMQGRNYASLSSFGKTMDLAAHLVLPIATLTVVSVGGLMRYTRTNMLEVLNSDYIRTARAKGLPENKVISRHAFRNTLIPLVTMLGGSLPGLFSGALITETLFGIRGIGFYSYYAMIGGDIPFTMFYLAFSAILTLLGTLMVLSAGMLLKAPLPIFVTVAGMLISEMVELIKALSPIDFRPIGSVTLFTFFSLKADAPISVTLNRWPAKRMDEGTV